MQLAAGTTVYVVGNDGLSRMTLEGLVNSVKGGTRLDQIQVFTEEEEAVVADVIGQRRRQVRQFIDERVMLATSMALLDASGKVISTIQLYTTR